MQYLSVAEAREATGLRLVLTARVPGPWGEAVKAVFKVRAIDYIPVEQIAMEANDELFAWTGHRNAPILCVEGEPPRTTWLDILLLAERRGAGPALLPEGFEDRALCLGLITEIAGVDGLGWNRRLQMMAMVSRGADAPPSTARDYGMSRAAVARAPERVASILRGLAERLERQKGAGSPFLVGDRLSAADLYWACFSMMMRPLPADVNPMPGWLWPLYSHCGEIVDRAVEPILIEHRDRIYRDHIGLPLDY
jgi:glutathione S-transferase